MTSSVQDIKKSIVIKTNDIARMYLDIGRLLCELNEKHCKTAVEFKKHLSELGFSYRKAVYLMRCYEAVSWNGIPEDDCNGIGWKKMSILYPHLSRDNYQKFFDMAKEYTVAQLQSVVKTGLSAPAQAGVFTIVLSSDELALLNDKLRKHGLRNEGTRNSNRSQSFMMMVAAA